MTEQVSCWIIRYWWWWWWEEIIIICWLPCINNRNYYNNMRIVVTGYGRRRRRSLQRTTGDTNTDNTATTTVTRDDLYCSRTRGTAWGATTRPPVYSESTSTTRIILWVACPLFDGTQGIKFSLPAPNVVVSEMVCQRTAHFETNIMTIVAAQPQPLPQPLPQPQSQQPQEQHLSKWWRWCI